MLKTIVKVSEVNNLSDARYCAGMGVEYIGFSMDNVPFEKYKEMRGWLAGVQIVGETSSNNALHIQEMVSTFLPDAIQISANSGD
jgi:phosphoribosylanthranilate isomerase